MNDATDYGSGPCVFTREHQHAPFCQMFGGRMPVTDTWDRAWYETPNIHPCTILDFFDLCALEGIAVEQWLAVDEHGLKAPWKRSVWLANIFGEQALFQLTRR